MQLHHIAIICSDEKSLAFYKLLGFEEVNRIMRPEHHDEIVWMKAHGATLELFIDNSHPERLTNPEANGLRHLAFSVGGVDAVVAMREALQDYEPEPIQQDSFTGEKLFFVKDPDGLPVEIRERMI